MPVATRLSLVTLVLLVGVGAAMMFRKESPEPPKDVSQSPDPLLLRKSPTEAAPRATVVRASEASSKPPREVSVLRGKLDDPAAGGKVILPPDLDNSFAQPLMPTRPVGMKRAVEPEPVRLPQTDVAVGEDAEERETRSEPRIRVVVDGDSLRSLAKRYLGSSERYLEIYEANRDVLESPELLEIGMRLKIPSDRPAKPGGGEESPVRKLVPINR